METNKIESAVQGLAMGALLTLILYVVFNFAPALMLSLSITDIIYDWDVTETVRRPIPEIFYDIPGFLENNEDSPGLGMYTADVPVDSFASASIFFCIIFAFLCVAQKLMVLQIRTYWPIIIGWWIISIHPFYYWFEWFSTMDPGPFPGVDWLPSCFFF